MKYLKRYKIFLESDEFEIEETDTPDIQMSKEKMNTTMSQISEYKTKKSKIDNIYLKSESSEDIESQLETLLGKTDTQNGSDRNPFLVDYTHIAKLERDINKSQDDNVKDKIKIDDLQQEVSLSTDDTKKDLEIKISEIKKRMSERSSKISEIQKDLIDNEKEHKEKMIQIEKDIKDHIEKISTPQ